jgi:hypothetical protein
MLVQRSFQGLQLFLWIISYENHNLGIKLVFTFESPMNLFHFDVVFTTIYNIYFNEESGGSSQVQAMWMCFLRLCVLFLYIDFILNSILWTCTNPMSKPPHLLTLWKIENMTWIYIIYGHTQCIGGYNSPKWWAMENEGMVPISMH